jgi:hypothetical protein
VCSNLVSPKTIFCKNIQNTKGTCGTIISYYFLLEIFLTSFFFNLNLGQDPFVMVF